MAEGRGGVVKKFLATPPRLRELLWLRDFLFVAHPPLLLLRRGAHLSRHASTLCYMLQRLKGASF